MAWQQNKPAAGDLLAQSQGDIQGNFQALNTLVNPTIPSVTLTQIPGAAPGAIANTWQIYNAPLNATSTLYLESPAGTQIPMTSALAANPGWTWLPSGIKMWWQSIARPGGGTTTLNFNAAANFPGFATFTVPSLAFQAPGGFPNEIVYYSVCSLTSITLQWTPNVQRISVIVIGA